MDVAPTFIFTVLLDSFLARLGSKLEILTYTRLYRSLKVLHFRLVRNYGLQVCGLVFTSQEARILLNS